MNEFYETCNIDDRPYPPAFSKEDPDDDEPDMDAGADEALKRFKMVDARLRRLCEKKKNGKCKVPEMLHNMWATGGSDRDKLRVLFEQMELDKALAYCRFHLGWPMMDLNELKLL